MADRTITTMRISKSLLSVLSVATLSLVAEPAFAEAPAKAAKAAKAKAPSSKKAEPVLVASAEPLPPLPPPAPAPVPPPVVVESPQKDAPVAPATNERPPAGSGFVFAVTSGIDVLAGEIGKGVDVGAAYVSVDVKAGYFVTSHLGFVAGVRGGYGMTWEGCKECSALSVQVPVMAQYAFGDRRHGAYVDGGLALFSTYAAGNPKEGETLSMSTPFDVKLGLGYRVGGQVTRDNPSPRSSLDMRLGLDLGKFASLAYGNAAGEVDGEIAKERQALHYVVGLSAGTSFGL